MDTSRDAFWGAEVQYFGDAVRVVREMLGRWEVEPDTDSSRLLEGMTAALGQLPSLESAALFRYYSGTPGVTATRGIIINPQYVTVLCRIADLLPKSPRPELRASLISLIWAVTTKAMMVIVSETQNHPALAKAKQVVNGYRALMLAQWLPLDLFDPCGARPNILGPAYQCFSGTSDQTVIAQRRIIQWLYGALAS